MRISTSSIYDLGILAIQRQQADVLKSQQQVSTGRRVLTPSDDPVAAARALDVTQSFSTNEQFATNRKMATSKLSQEEDILASVTSLIQDVKTLAVNGGDPALSNDNRVSLAAELRGRYQELISLANSTDGNGEFLFAGYRSSTLPFTETSPGNVAYNGDQGQQLIQTGVSRQLAVNDAGVEVFQNIKNGNGSFVTAAASGNVGGGVISAGSVLDPTKWAAAPNKDFTIKISANAEVAPAATNSTGAGIVVVTAGIVDQKTWDAGGKSLNISFAGTGPYTYTVTDPVTSASASGTYTVGTPLTVNFEGAAISLNGGTLAAGDSFTIKPTGTPGWTYDLIDNVTGNSLLTGATPASPPYLRNYSSGSTISLSQVGPPAFDYGAQLSITGSPAGGDMFTVKASTSESLFTTLDHLITALQTTSGARLNNSLNTALTNIDNADIHVLKVRASVGARLNEIDTAQSLGEELSVQYKQTLSTLQDVDYAAAISELTQNQTYLEAAQKSYLKVTQMSLFNFL